MHMNWTHARSIRLVALGAMVVSCTVQGRDDDFDDSLGSAGMTAADGSSGPAGESSDGVTPDDDGDDDDGSDSADTGGTTIRCDKIDIVFVLETGHTAEDGTAPYGNVQVPVVEGFATLVSELYVSLEVDDFRVMVTGSMAADPQEACVYDYETMTQECAEPTLDACDDILGAGRNGFDYPLDPGGIIDGEPSEECMPGRWIESGVPELGPLFSCLFDYTWFDADTAGAMGTRVPFSGSGPDTMMDATLAALGPLTEAGACNAGFVRDDALLVIVFVAPSTDDLPDTSSGAVAEWVAALSDVKHGIAGNVVLLALVGDGDVEQSLCATTPVGPGPAQLRELTEAMPHGKWASTCLPDYKPFFTSASELVDAACNDFTPEG
jgi:hypothetical protein